MEVESTVVVVTGKGGVGKTTVASALVAAAAGRGLRALLVRTDPGGGGSGPGSSTAITAESALSEYLAASTVGRLVHNLAPGPTLELVATATPGLKDLLVLAKVRKLEESGDWDLIAVDAPASGHALGFLSAPAALARLARSGPIHDQATRTESMLRDGSRARALLVSLPEPTPVTEMLELAEHLDERVGLASMGAVVNGLMPPWAGLDVDPVAAAAEAEVELDGQDLVSLRRTATLLAPRRRSQLEQMARIAESFPGPVATLPASFDTVLSPEMRSSLADILDSQMRFSA